MQHIILNSVIWFVNYIHCILAFSLEQILDEVFPTKLTCNTKNNMHSASKGNDRAVMRANEQLDVVPPPGHLCSSISNRWGSHAPIMLYTEL